MTFIAEVFKLSGTGSTFSFREYLVDLHKTNKNKICNDIW